MSTLLAVREVIETLCMVICAGALLWMGVAVHGACRVVKRSASRISGAVAAARELASRIDAPPKAAKSPGSPSESWGDLIGGHPRR